MTTQTMRSEVYGFIRATETLLSNTTLDELNQDERDMVAICIRSLAEKYPMIDAPPYLFH